MEKGEIYKDTKRCLICGVIKKIHGNFRIVNAVNGYTSKTCRVCENSTTLQDDVKNSYGYLYVLFDSVYPAYIKIGYTTNKKTRLIHYNANRPLDTCNYVYVSKRLNNIFKREQDILRRIYTYAYSTPNRKEWFSIEYKERLIQEIKHSEADSYWK